MTYRLAFSVRHEYDAGDRSITIPVILFAGKEPVQAEAKLDTGADHCIFQREIGEELGLLIEAGEPKEFAGVHGKANAYGHSVTLSMFGYEFDSVVYFIEYPGFPRNLLGRIGFFDKFRFALIEYDGTLYLSRYDEDDEYAERF